VKILFSLCFAAYIVHTMLANRRDDPAHWRFTRGMLLIQTPLFLLACYFARQHGAFSRDLVSPLHIGAGLLIGHAIFAVSLLITHGVLRDAAAHFLEVGPFLRFLAETPMLMMRFIAVSITEEIIYRAAAQPLLTAWTGRPMLAVVVVALAFAIVHKHFLKNPPVQSAEFLAFSLLLGGLYYWTNSLSLVVVVHALRNLESLYLEYLMKTEELGDAQRALNALEQTYQRLPGERV